MAACCVVGNEIFGDSVIGVWGVEVGVTAGEEVPLVSDEETGIVFRSDFVQPVSARQTDRRNHGRRIEVAEAARIF